MKLLLLLKPRSPLPRWLTLPVLPSTHSIPRPTRASKPVSGRPSEVRRSLKSSVPERLTLRTLFRLSCLCFVMSPPTSPIITTTPFSSTGNEKRTTSSLKDLIELQSDKSQSNQRLPYLKQPIYTPSVPCLQDVCCGFVYRGLPGVLLTMTSING